MPFFGLDGGLRLRSALGLWFNENRNRGLSGAEVRIYNNPIRNFEKIPINETPLPRTRRRKTNDDPPRIIRLF